MGGSGKGVVGENFGGVRIVLFQVGPDHVRHDDNLNSVQALA